jgi:hypothetical protein
MWQDRAWAQTLQNLPHGAEKLILSQLLSVSLMLPHKS